MYKSNTCKKSSKSLNNPMRGTLMTVLQMRNGKQDYIPNPRTHTTTKHQTMMQLCLHTRFPHENALRIGMESYSPSYSQTAVTRRY